MHTGGLDGRVRGPFPQDRTPFSASCTVGVMGERGPFRVALAGIHLIIKAGGGGGG